MNIKFVYLLIFLTLLQSCKNYTVDNNIITIKYDNGDEYTGKIKNGKRYGYGILITANGDTLIGNWNNDILDGYAVMSYNQDLSVYCGIVKNGKYGEGPGVLKVGQLYSAGNWLDGHMNGFGMTSLEGDDNYIGNYVKGNKDGFGYYKNIKYSYIGKWKNDNREGEGRTFFNNGSFEHGLYKEGKLYTTYEARNITNNYNDFKCLEGNCQNGTGISEYRDGCRYSGKFKNRKRWGEGTLACDNGRKYVGLWANDKRSGHGKEIFPSGDVVSGEFRDEFKYGFWKEKDGSLTIFNQDGTVEKRSSDGSILKTSVSNIENVKRVQEMLDDLY